MWVAPEDKDPVVLHAPTRKSIACFGAVHLNGGQFVWSTSPKFNADTFEWFLRQLLRHRRRGKRMVVVVDNAGYHHARQLQPFLHRFNRAALGGYRLEVGQTTRQLGVARAELHRSVY